ncbi:MAG TPA: formylmethanofuran dehydrogenase subunit C [Candidatus Polarisedimenticolia bacterium]|nr:formylmethanofuran dehydrogenase subunit C [Candidatus Polarisedimenticolia bacterium]
MSLRLTLRAWPFPPGMEAEAPDLLPERLAGLSREKIGALPVRVGRRTERLGDLVDVDGAPGAAASADHGAGRAFVLSGDLRPFARLGAGMTAGRMIVEGHAGPCAGAGMRGGRLEIEGDAGRRAGEGMTGGILVVRGSAGDDLGGAGPAAARGLNRGAIFVAGNAGARAGRRMRRGLIAIGGEAGPLLGTEMLAGTIVVLGRAGDGAGTWMRRGTIVLGAGPVPSSPAFAAAGSLRFSFWSLYDEALRAAGVPLPESWRGGRFRRFVGDRSGAGLGEILVPPEDGDVLRPARPERRTSCTTRP